MVRNLLLLSLLAFSSEVLSGQDKPAGEKSTGEKSDNSMNLFGDSNAKGPTIVTSNQEANFDSKTHVAVFVGNVQVQDPQFSMTCDKLTVQLNKDQGGMKQADADGNVNIISVKKGKDGAADEKSTGKGDKAIYTPPDGRIVLTGNPQMEQNGNTHVSTEYGTKMTMYKDGRMHTVGGSRTIIQPAASPSPKPAAVLP